MNNLFIVALAGSLGLALYCKTQSAMAEVAAANIENNLKVKASIARASDGRAEVRRLERLITTEKENIQTLRGNLNVLAAKQAAEADDLAELTPQKEGFWPIDKPYFYISKAQLRGLGYWPFTDNEDRLSRQASLLFGMTPQEQSAANVAYLEMREKIRMLEKASAIATNTPIQVADSPGTKITYFIPAVPRETLDAMNAEFKGKLAEALGSVRADILSRRIDETFETSPHALTQPRTLTLVRDGDRIQLVESDGENTTRGSTTEDDGRQVIPRAVRHLFEE